MQKVNLKVAGVTFENRQAIVAILRGNELVVLKREPENPHDQNAIAIYVLLDMNQPPEKLGYVPRDQTAEITPHMDSGHLVGSVAEVTGGFEKLNGQMASFGVRVVVDIPDA